MAGRRLTSAKRQKTSSATLNRYPAIRIRACSDIGSAKKDTLI
jgi:hypothetical protein